MLASVAAFPLEPRDPLDPEPKESPEGIPGDPNGRFPRGHLPVAGQVVVPQRPEMDQLTLL